MDYSLFNCGGNYQVDMNTQTYSQIGGGSTEQFQERRVNYQDYLYNKERDESDVNSNSVFQKFTEKKKEFTKMFENLNGSKKASGSGKKEEQKRAKEYFENLSNNLVLNHLSVRESLCVKLNELLNKYKFTQDELENAIQEINLKENMNIDLNDLTDSESFLKSPNGTILNGVPDENDRKITYIPLKAKKLDKVEMDFIENVFFNQLIPCQNRFEDFRAEMHSLMDQINACDSITKIVKKVVKKELIMDKDHKFKNYLIRLGKEEIASSK